MRWWFLLAVGCGRVGFGELGRDASPLTDGGSDGPRAGYREAVLADSPVAYWRLDDPDLTARDELGTYPGTYDAACTRGPGALTGDVDQATAFDGTTCGIDFGVVLGRANTAPFTVELWLYPTAMAGTEALFMRETRTGNGPIDGYAIAKTQAGVYLERASGANNVTTPKAPFTLNTWLYAVGTYDGATLAFYADGALVGSVGDTRPLPVFVSTHAYIGINELGATLFHGSIDEVAVYDHALTIEQIANHFAIGTNGP